MKPQLDYLRRELSRKHQVSYGWAGACCRHDPELGQEVLQKAYLKILEGRAIFKWRSTIKTWLFGVIRNTAREHLRKIRMKSLIVPPDGSLPSGNSDPAEALTRKSDRDRLMAVLRSLPKRQQEVLYLVFYQELAMYSLNRRNRRFIKTRRRGTS